MKYIENVLQKVLMRHEYHLNLMNIIILGVRIIEDSDNRGLDNRGCTVANAMVRIVMLVRMVANALLIDGNVVMQ